VPMISCGACPSAVEFDALDMEVRRSSSALPGLPGSSLTTASPPRSTSCSARHSGPTSARCGEVAQLMSGRRAATPGSILRGDQREGASIRERRSLTACSSLLLGVGRAPCGTSKTDKLR
jgi:hypothetical protein